MSSLRSDARRMPLVGQRASGQHSEERATDGDKYERSSARPLIRSCVWTERASRVPWLSPIRLGKFRVRTADRSYPRRRIRFHPRAHLHAFEEGLRAMAKNNDVVRAKLRGGESTGREISAHDAPHTAVRIRAWRAPARREHHAASDALRDRTTANPAALHDAEPITDMVRQLRRARAIRHNCSNAVTVTRRPSALERDVRRATSHPGMLKQLSALRGAGRAPSALRAEIAPQHIWEPPSDSRAADPISPGTAPATNCSVSEDAA